jgi:hypothetical protein
MTARTDAEREGSCPTTRTPRSSRQGTSPARSFYFHPDSVEALYEEIKDHTSPTWGPEVRDWEARELGLRDPNGYFLTFTEDAEP